MLILEVIPNIVATLQMALIGTFNLLGTINLANEMLSNINNGTLQMQYFLEADRALAATLWQ